MLKLNSILLFSEHPKELSEFYKKVFGKNPDMDEDNYFGFKVGDSFLTIGSHDKVKGNSKNPERMLFNFETNDVKGEFERIKKLGATVIAEPYQMGKSSAWIATFSDPNNNYFQLMSPWE